MMTSVGEDVEKMDPADFAGGKAKWCSCSGKTVAVPQNFKPAVTI